MIVYGIDEITHAFTGECECQIDPVASKREGKPVYLMPSGCTAVPPPEFDVKTQFVEFVDGGWVIHDIPPDDDPPKAYEAMTYEEAYDELKKGVAL